MRDDLRHDVVTFLEECARADSDCGESVRTDASRLHVRAVNQQRRDFDALAKLSHDARQMQMAPLTPLVEFDPCRACKRLSSIVAIHSLTLLILAAFFAWFMFSMVGVMKP